MFLVGVYDFSDEIARVHLLLFNASALDSIQRPDALLTAPVRASMIASVRQTSVCRLLKEDSCDADQATTRLLVDLAVAVVRFNV